MKKRIASFCAATMLVVCLLLSCAMPTAAAGYPLPADTSIYAESAILMHLAGDPNLDMVLYEKEADQVRSPGAMMRYMVLAYALHQVETKGLDIDADTGTYSEDLFNGYVAGTGVPTANMQYGETWRLRDLMTVSFMHNASDAVVVLAKAIDGDVRTFIDGMNSLATELGCANSHFYWLSGLDSLSQYTTARDMCRIVRYCQSFSLFEDIAATSSVTVKPTKGGTERTISGSNHMMQGSSVHYYSPIVHSRTGLSDNDGRTCAAVAREGGYEYLAVVMGSPEVNEDGESGIHYRDVKTLFKWAFRQFEHKTVLVKSEILASVDVGLSWDVDHVNLVPAKEVATVVDADVQADQIIRKVTVNQKQVNAPIEKGTVYGKVELFVNVDQKIGEVDLVAATTIARSEVLYAWETFRSTLGNALPYLLIGAGALVLLIIGYIILAINHNRRRRRQDLSHFNRQQ